MQGMNWSRIWLGGLAAGVVMNLIDAAVNGFLLASRWERESEALRPGLMSRMATTSTIGWIVFDFALGVLLVWLYAAIRPRYGPGPRTALIAGMVLWLATHLAFASLAFMGMFSPGLVLASSVGGILSAAAGAYVGGMIYREEGAPSTARAGA